MLHCELFPYLPSIFEKMVTLPRKPIVFDYDDAIFHNYDINPKWYVRKLGKNFIIQLEQQNSFLWK